ncbi:hypothetical protein D3C80_2122840 [compost metagenome]
MLKFVNGILLLPEGIRMRHPCASQQGKGRESQIGRVVLGNQPVIAVFIARAQVNAALHTTVYIIQISVR